MWTIRLVAIRLLAILKFLQQVSRLKTKVEKIDNCCKYPTNNQKEFTLRFQQKKSRWYCCNDTMLNQRKAFSCSPVVAFSTDKDGTDGKYCMCVL